MKLAIASPSASVYSETFIHMQMERLPCLLRIHGSPVATETIPGGAIRPLGNIRGIWDTAVECGLRGKRWEGPQGRELARRLRRYRVDRILANYGPTAVALAPLCKELGIKLIAHFHGYDAHMKSVIEEYGPAYQLLGKQAAAIIAVSRKMEQCLVDLRMPADRIHLIRCGVDPERFIAKSAFPENPMFFGIGRFVDKKAPYLTLLAFKEVYEVVPSARLILAGDGPLLETTRNLAQALNLSESVKFPGVLAPDQVAAHMQEATAYVQHSVIPQNGQNAGDSEGTPVAVLEALISGLPVVSTVHAGIGEVVQDQKTGFLVNERDVKGMGAAMIRLATQPDLASRLGAEARRDALEKYTASQYIDSLHRVIENI